MTHQKRPHHHGTPIQVNITAVDATGAPINGALITLFMYDAGGRACPLEPAIRDQSNFYNSDEPYEPHDRNAPFTVYGQASAFPQGFSTNYIAPTTWDGRSSLNLTVTLPPFV